MPNRIREMFGRKILKYVIRKKNKIKIHFAQQLNFGKMSLITFFPAFIKLFSFNVFIKRFHSQNDPILCFTYYNITRSIENSSSSEII